MRRDNIIKLNNIINTVIHAQGGEEEDFIKH